MPSKTEGNLEKILERVRTLISTAENLDADALKPGVSDADRAAFTSEAEARRTMADALMLKYQIEEITAEQQTGIQSKPKILTINIGPDSEVIGYFNWLMMDLAKHCRCRIRSYTSWTSDGWNAKVYGFESDVQYFNLMYTTIRLHMTGILLPRIDRNESMEDNAYRLHNSGYNWLQIAEMYGWNKYSFSFAGIEGKYPPADMKVPYYMKGGEGGKVEFQPATQVGSRIKRAYHRACKARGESVQVIAANGTATYRKSAADGYVSMIRRRLFLMAKERQSGTEVILRSRIDALDALFKEDNPDMFQEVKEEPSNTKGKQRKIKYVPMKVNEDAYRRGADHARNADLSGNSRMGNGGQNALNG